MFVAIPFLGAIFGAVGFILVLVAVGHISKAVKDRSLYNNMLVAVALAITGQALAVFVVVDSAISFAGLKGLAGPQLFALANITSGNWLGLVLSLMGGLFVVWILMLVSATYVRRTYNSISARLHDARFRRAGLVYLFGAATTIILIGFVLLLVSQILLVLAFFSMGESLPTLPAPQIHPIQPPTQT